LAQSIDTVVIIKKSVNIEKRPRRVREALKKTQFTWHSVFFESSGRDGLFYDSIFIEFSGLMCLFNFQLVLFTFWSGGRLQSSRERTNESWENA
jgi:hypothetical protein